jgi:hypothetical protein
MVVGTKTYACENKINIVQLQIKWVVTKKHEIREHIKKMENKKLWFTRTTKELGNKFNGVKGNKKTTRSNTREWEQNLWLIEQSKIVRTKNLSVKQWQK